MTLVSLTTINLNGIRAATKRGFQAWLETAGPDVLLMQEVRADEQIATSLLGDSWHSVFYPSQIKGRAGVGVAVRKDSKAVAPRLTEDVRRGLSDEEVPVDSGRWLEVPLDTSSGHVLRVVSAYFHSGEVGTPRQDAKMAHFEPLTSRFDSLLTEASNGGSHAVVAGDFNVVRSEADIKNWKPNHNKRAGVLDEEIVYLNRWVDQGWVDSVRQLAGDGPGPYSWWSWRGKAFDNDTGWRIDYQYATPGFGAGAQNFSIFRAPSWDTRFSDHAPVTVTYLV
ncbi:exodeoxyribonuclease III [Actinomycetaceae bacterium MB13-C1-2]|nr:exodeoxyribonuclease III [Actinomycetaceae bacterium MB13-C1-2]